MEKSFKNVFDTQKIIFFLGHFLEKKIKKHLENCLRAKNVSKLKKQFFPKKCPEKNVF